MMRPSVGSLVTRLRSDEPILMDGATGTEIARRGVDVARPEWSSVALTTSPEIVRDVHESYVAAGSELVTANTFRTHARNLVAAGLADRAEELTAQAVELARGATDGTAWVVGSQAPLEDCYSPQLVPAEAELETEHRQMSRNLADAGVDAILVETQNTIREAAIATRVSRETGLPVLVSFVCGVDGRLLSGETLSSAARAVVPIGPAAILVNCLPVDSVPGALAELRRACPDITVGAYANIGYADEHGQWILTDAVDPKTYARSALAWLSAGALLVGGCCGTTPQHIAEIRDAMRE